MSDTDVVFVGAGYSRAATSGSSPLMSDFFSLLDDRKYWTLFKFLSECFDDPLSANVEEAILALDQLRASPLKGKDSFFEQCRIRHDEIKRELDGYTMERLGKLNMADDSWAALFLLNVGDKTTVVTTNYDNIAEAVLSHRPNLRHHVANTNCHHCRMCAILNADCDCGSDSLSDDYWRGCLLKLHGSIAWQMCNNTSCSSSGCLVPDEHCMPREILACDRCGRACSTVLVHPSMVKNFNEFEPLRLMWNGAYDAMRQARRVLFFGFSFPRSDAVIGEVIRATLGSKPRSIDIAIVDVTPDAPIARLRELTSRNPMVKLHRLTVPNDGQPPDWLDWQVNNKTPVFCP